MKKMYLPVIVIMCFVQQIVMAQNTLTLRIDPDNARGGAVSEIFDSLVFTPLETTKESVFGQIDQLEITDSFFIILDNSTHSILLFNKNGSLHARIKAEKAHTYFTYFTLNRLAANIIVGTNLDDNLLVYDYNGRLLQKQPAPKNITTLYYFNQNAVLYNIQRTDKVGPGAAPYDLALSNGFNSVTRYINPYNPTFQDGMYNIMANPINFSGQDGTCMFSLPFDYNVYQLADTGITTVYKFIFPLGYSLPAGFATDSSFAGRRAQYVYQDQENYKKINSVSSAYRLGNWLLFSASASETYINADFNYLYNVKTASLISLSRVTADSGSYYLPILSTLFETPKAVHNGYLYSSFASFRLIALQKKLDKKVVYPPALQIFFNTATKEDNQVIVQMKLKSNIN